MTDVDSAIPDVAASAPPAFAAGSTPTPAEVAEHASSLVGFHYTADDHYEVGREKVREFARAVQDFHPAHWDETKAAELGYPGLLAPLTFVSLVGMIAQRRLFDDVIGGYDLSQIMQTDQRLQFHRPMRAGDRLLCDVSLDSFRQVGPADVMVTKNIIRDQNGELVLTTWTSLAARKPVVGEDEAAAKADLLAFAKRIMMIEGGAIESMGPRGVHAGGLPARDDDATAFTVPAGSPLRTFDSVAVGDELPPRTVELTRGSLANYGGVVGDPNPIHFSSEFARAAGLDDVVAHGMLTMGIAASFVTGWLGDPGAVTDFNVRFTSPAYVPATEVARLDYTGRVKSLDPATKTGVVALVAKQGDRRIFGRATATVRFA